MDHLAVITHITARKYGFDGSGTKKNELLKCFALVTRVVNLLSLTMPLCFPTIPHQPDPDEGILAHLAGRKTALLIPPFDKTKSDLDELFKYRWKTGSLTDLYLHGDEGFASNVTKYWVELEPGDLLYIPKSWLHDIESATETVSLVTRFEIVEEDAEEEE